MTDKATVFDEYAKAQTMPTTVPEHFTPWVQGPAGTRILDLGCGDGRFLRFCRAVVPQSEPVGIDVSLVRARRAANEGFTMAQAEGERLPFADSSFDLVLLIEVIEHTWRPEAVIAEIARILVPQGRLILTTPNYPIKQAYDWMNHLRGARVSPADDPTHFSPFSLRSIRRLCARYFADVESQTNRVAGEGRLPVLAHLKSIPFVRDLVGHKVMVFCRQPLRKGSG